MYNSMSNARRLGLPSLWGECLMPEKSSRGADSFVLSSRGIERKSRAERRKRTFGEPVSTIEKGQTRFLIEEYPVSDCWGGVIFAPV